MALHITKLSMYASIVLVVLPPAGGGRGTNEPPAHLPVDCAELAQHCPGTTENIFLTFNVITFQLAVVKIFFNISIGRLINLQFHQFALGLCTMGYLIFAIFQCRV
jgi:hypothetical protein